MGSRHIFDRGMDIFDGAHRAGDEADALWTVSSGIVVIFPRLLDGRVIVDKTFRCAKNQVSASKNTVQMFLKGWVFPCLLWVPGPKERQNSLGRRRIHILQQTFVVRFTGGEAFLCSLGLAFVVDP